MSWRIVSFRGCQGRPVADSVPSPFVVQPVVRLPANVSSSRRLRLAKGFPRRRGSVGRDPSRD